MLNGLMDPSAADFSIDSAGQQPPYHPHITAPYLRVLISEQFPNAPKLEYITTIRNPVDMLFSYYKFFQPDENGRYNYEPHWLGSIGMQFEQWIIGGRVGANPKWLEYGPPSISVRNLSPLSIEAHAFDRNGTNMIDHVFRVEVIHELVDWLEEKTKQTVELEHVNESAVAALPHLGSEAMERIRIMFPYEAAEYNI